MSLRIGTRVRHRSTGDLGTIFAVPYTFRGERRAGVVWDDAPGWLCSTPVSELTPVKPEPARVPLEGRPLSVGALAGGAK